MSALQRAALLRAADGRHADAVIPGRVEVGDQHLAVRLGDDDLPLLPTCRKTQEREVLQSTTVRLGIFLNLSFIYLSPPAAIFSCMGAKTLAFS